MKAFSYFIMLTNLNHNSLLPSAQGYDFSDGLKIMRKHMGRRDPNHTTNTSVTAKYKDRCFTRSLARDIMKQEPTAFIAIGGVFSLDRRMPLLVCQMDLYTALSQHSHKICIACHCTLVKVLFKLIWSVLEYGNKTVQYETAQLKLVSLDRKMGLGILLMNQYER